MRQSSELGVDVGDQFLNHEVFPVTCYRRVYIPGATERGGHIDRDQKEFRDDSGEDCPVEEGLRAIPIEGRPIALEGARQKVDDGVAASRFAVSGWEVHCQFPDCTGSDFIVREFRRVQLQAHDLAFGDERRR